MQKCFYKTTPPPLIPKKVFPYLPSGWLLGRIFLARTIQVVTARISTGIIQIDLIKKKLIYGRRICFGTPVFRIIFNGIPVLWKDFFGILQQTLVTGQNKN